MAKYQLLQQEMSDGDHPFSQYLRILGRGKKGSRSLTEDEAYDAFRLILEQQVEPLQIGAFLLLLRVKEESVEELTGFVRASKDCIQLPDLEVDIDWSSYAGKRKQYPWFIMAALTLAQHGYRVFMHGGTAHTANRLYTETALKALGIDACKQPNEVAAALDQRNFAYMPISALHPMLGELLQLKPILGLRSPVHSLVRLINPFQAKYSFQAIFHPAYRQSHQQVGLNLGYHSAVIKGEGGEFERNPDARTLVQGAKHGTLFEQQWPMLNTQRTAAEPQFDLDFYTAVWRGEQHSAYAEQAILGTLAIVLSVIDSSLTQSQAMQKSTSMWLDRHQICA